MNLVKKLIELDAKTNKLIAVVGDALMDIYVHGTLADCQDGCQKFMESFRVECPGGAANAANTLVNWNCNVQLHSNIAPGTKTRFMFGERCVLRHDDDTIDRASTLEARRRYMFSLLAKSKPDAILISDYDKGFLTPDFIRKVYAVCKSISMDNGVMEKARDVKVILADIGWSDLGTWKSLHEINEKDELQNAVDANVMLYETKDCIIKAPKDKLVVIHGLSNYIVAEHGNVLMICPKDQEQQVKQFVEDATKLDPNFS